MALHALAEPGHHPGLHGWATATAAGLKPDLADRLHEADFLWRSTFSDVFMPFAGLPAALSTACGPTGACFAEELDMLDRLDDERFVAAALEFTCASTYGTPSPSALTDPARRERALELAATRGPKQLDFTRRLLDDPASVRTWVRRLFEDCNQSFFADTWRRVRPQLAADARHKTELLRRKGLAEALHAVSPRSRWTRTGHVSVPTNSRTGGRPPSTPPSAPDSPSYRPASAGRISWCCTRPAGGR